jgi:CDP-diacylglycerol--serine O-phosphatidyltransferase
VLDSLDGRVARLTNTTSDFGAQYDSLADMVSFGVAPALVIYIWSMHSMGKLGWLATFIYIVCEALMLARFNTNINIVDKRFFQGMPSPAAAALLAGLVWVATDLRETKWIDWSAKDLRWVVWSVAVYAGLTMVSSVPFYSFKDLNLRKSVPFVVVFLVAMGLVLISQDPPTLLFLLMLAYSVSGWVLFFWRKARGERVEVFADDQQKDL